MDLFNRENEYNIDAEENVPQLVYGIPDNLQKDNIEKDKNAEFCVFSAVEKIYQGSSYYYFVNNKGNDYYFRFGVSKNGNYIVNDQDDPNIMQMIQNRDYYNQMINDINSITKDWKESYLNSTILEGTQWHIELNEPQKKFSGTNDFPNNYNELMNILKKYFNCELFIKELESEERYNVDPVDNIPQKVYGIPNIKKEENRVCPYCGSASLWKYPYDEPFYDFDKNKYVLGNTSTTDNQPIFKCKNCNMDVYTENRSMNDMINKYNIENEDNFTQEAYGISDVVSKNNGDEKEERITIKLSNNKSDFTIMLQKLEKECSLFFVKGALEDNFYVDALVQISVAIFNLYSNRLANITSNWGSIGRKQVNELITWKVKMKNINFQNSQYLGEREVPLNWNEFVDCISELEIVFKKAKEMNDRVLPH